MNCFLIMVGSELLNGMMIDTNSVFAAEQLNKYGIEIKGKIVTGDVVSEIESAIRYAKENADIVIMSGGLGPTIDDLTRDAVANYCNVKLVLNENEFDVIKARYSKLFKASMPERNIRQAMFPEKAVIIENKKGSAQSFYINKIACFPGVPDELKDSLPRFLEYLKKEENITENLFIKDLLVWGLPEAETERRILDIIENEKRVFVEFLVKKYATLIRFVYKKENIHIVESLKNDIYARIGEFIFGEDEERLEGLLYKLLKKNGYRLRIAESCTGGIISSYITSIPGVSEVFIDGVVTYSNESKIEKLGVKIETLQKYGAVSTETVREMLEGLKSEAGIAVSGIAGPDGGTEEKPVGTVFIGIKLFDKIEVERYQFFGQREGIRERASLTAINNLRKLILKMEKK